MQEQANTEEAKAKALVADDETDARMEYIVISILAEVNWGKGARGAGTEAMEGRATELHNTDGHTADGMDDGTSVPP